MNFFSYNGRIGRQKYIIGLIVAAVLSAIIGFLYFFVVLSSLVNAIDTITIKGRHFVNSRTGEDVLPEISEFVN